jgi:hypothetical protein
VTARLPWPPRSRPGEGLRDTWPSAVRHRPAAGRCGTGLGTSHKACDSDHTTFAAPLFAQVRVMPGGVSAGQSGSQECRSHLTRSEGKGTTGARERRGQHSGLFNVDNFAGNVDGVATRNIFRAQAVDGITPSSRRGGRPTSRAVPPGIPRLRTQATACRHRLSTDLSTRRLDTWGNDPVSR